MITYTNDYIALLTQEQMHGKEASKVKNIRSLKIEKVRYENNFIISETIS